jgi:phage shock protein C
MKKKHLTKSKSKVFLGVCGGIAAYLGVDPTVVRLVVLILLVCTGFFPIGLIYLVAALIMPDYDSNDRGPHILEGTFKEKDKD